MNTHILCDPSSSDVKLWQAGSLKESVILPPVLLVGEFPYQVQPGLLVLLLRCICSMGQGHTSLPVTLIPLLSQPWRAQGFQRRLTLTEVYEYLRHGSVTAGHEASKGSFQGELV